MIAIVLHAPSEKRTVLAIVLDKNNIDRMRIGDPAELPLTNLPIPEGLDPHDMTVLVCYDDIPKILALQDSGGGPAVMRRLCRNWRTMDDDGSVPVKLTAKEKP